LHDGPGAVEDPTALVRVKGWMILVALEAILTASLTTQAVMAIAALAALVTVAASTALSTLVIVADRHLWLPWCLLLTLQAVKAYVAMSTLFSLWPP
jgi:hypothetical protein